MTPLFLPSDGIGIRIEANETSQRAQLVGDGDSIVATNIGTVPVFICFGRGDVVATNACYPCLPGTKESEIMLKNSSGDWIAAICDPGQSATIIIHRVSR